MVVGTGTAAAQVAALLVTPWLTRLYGPVAFGVFGVFFAVVMMVSVVASGRYEMAVPGARTDDEAARFLVGSLVVLVGSTGAAALIVAGLQIIFAVPIPVWMAASAAVFVLTAGIAQSFSYWLVRTEQYRSLSIARICLAVVSAIASVGLGYVTRSAWGLALGAAAGQVAGALASVLLAWPSLDRAWSDRSLAAVSETLRKNLEFPRVNAPHALIDGLRETGFQAVFALGFGAAATGFYSLGVRVLRAPASVAGAALSQVLFGRFSRDRREARSSRSLLLRMVGLLALISAPVFLAIAFFGPELFSFVFGPEWRVAGSYARIMAPAIWVSFAVAPAATLPVVAGRMRGAFRFAVADLAIKGVSLAIGLATGSAAIALVCLTITSVAISLGLLFWYLEIVGRGPRRLVVFVGQSRWSNVLRDEMNRGREAPPVVDYASVPIDRPWSVLRWSAMRNLLAADVLVRVGFRPAGDTLFGAAFETAWTVLRRLNRRARVVMYWIGTDVQRTSEMLGRGRNREAFAGAASRMAHYAGSDNLADELAALGVRSKVFWFPALTLVVPESVPPLPTEFTVLSYVPDGRPEFYGGPVLLALAAALPSIKVRIVGGSGAWATGVPDNVEFAGFVDDMSREYALSTVVVRLVEHDALGATAVEGLLFGRHVIYSNELQYALEVGASDVGELIRVVSHLYDTWTRGQLTPDYEAAAWASATFSQSERVDRLKSELESLC